MQPYEASDAVERAYRALAKEYHPDRNPGDEAAKAKWNELDAAHEAFKKERGL